MRLIRALALVFVALVAVPALARDAKTPLALIVMDPLSAELPCPCVAGYAQRNYAKLAAHLEKETGRRVQVHFTETLREALQKKSDGKADLVIGKDSVVRAGAKAAGINVSPLASLTGKDGKTTQTGLVLVPARDPALLVSDLKGYRLLFGPSDCEEKSAAPLKLLRESEIKAPEKLETTVSCSAGAAQVLKLHREGIKVAAVVSSYAQPLLEGCGTIKKGELRVIGETDPVPFIVAFVNATVNASDRAALEKALLNAGQSADFCEALETKKGFVALAAGKKVGEAPVAPVGWTGWRGPNRDGRVAWLPEKLPQKPKTLWETQLTAKGLGGVAATAKYVLVSDRELEDTSDCFRCLDAATGKEIWAVRYPAPGQLDYGNSSRATPLVHGDLVFLYGAFGHLTCAELATGKVLWEMDLRDTFGAKDERKWGNCASPLLVDGKLIVNPGGKDASLVALEPRTGKVLWKSPGKPAGYGSLLAGTFGGKKQIVGHDLDSLGGWDVVTGKRLWTLVPPRKNDFNVPTPVQVGDNLLVTTENNRTRLYGFKEGGVLDTKPLATNGDLAPDSHTPVVVGQRVFGVWGGLHCLDLKKGLKAVWSNDDEPAFKAYASLVATAERVLLTSTEGELFLMDARADRLKLLGRLKVFDDEKGVYSHPAFFGTRIYLRGNSSIVCVELKP